MSRFYFFLLPIFLITACHNVNQPTQKQVVPFETIKPGAGITLTHRAPLSMQSGRFQNVELTMDEIYDIGQMELQIIPSEGLRLFGGSDKKNFEMQDKSAHKWSIDVMSEEDGIYFLSIFAQANIEGVIESRNFSIRLDIGEITPAMRAKAFPENGTLSKNGKSRILEAVETFQ